MPPLEPDHPVKEKAPRRVRVLIVDDSALMRRLLADILGASAAIEVIGSARDGREAVAQTARLKPDVITLDVAMPELSGLDALPLILAVHETPVVMVSALTREGADVTLKALELGAVDFFPKPARNQLAELRADGGQLVAKVLAAATSRVFRARRTLSSIVAAPTVIPDAPRPPRADRDRDRDRPAPVVVLGISTGGPQALSRVIPLLRPPAPPILIVQHMPAQFTGVFADRLNRSAAVEVKEAVDGDPVLPNRVLVAPGDRHMRLAGRPPRARVTLSAPDEPTISGHRPSVDALFESAATIFQTATVGVIMTGMGRDGVAGCKAIQAAGGFILGQDEASSVVYGMNKAAFLENAVNAQFALDDLAAILQDLDAIRA